MQVSFPPLVLASSSPQRQELLKQIGLIPSWIENPNIDETPQRNEAPLALVKRLAHAKAESLKEKYKGHFIIAGDTIGYCRHRILEKPHSLEEAKEMLKTLSGSRHRFYSGVCIINPEGKIYLKTSTSFVQFKRLSLKEMEWYLKTREWENKSGGYSIRGYAAQFIKSIRGSYSGIVGLPLFETAQLLKGAGYPLNQIHD